MYLLTTFRRGKDLKKRKARSNTISKTVVGSGLGGLLGTGISSVAKKNKKIGLAAGMLLGATAGKVYSKEENKYNKSPLFYKAKVNTKETYEDVRNKTKKVIKKVNKVSNKLENYSADNLSEFRLIQVKESIRKSKKKGSYTVKAYTRKGKDKLVTTENVAKTVAGVVGVSALSYLALKGRYRSNMKKTLANAIKKADVMDVSAFKLSKKSNSLTFTIAGTGGLDNAVSNAKGVQGAVKGLTRNQNTFSINNNKFNVKSKFRFDIANEDATYFLNQWKRLNPNATAEEIAEQALKSRIKAQKLQMDMDHPIGVAKKIFQVYVKRGKNRQVEDTLATVIALHKKTGLPVNLVGTSGGGLITDEVSEHLMKLGIPHKGINLGSPNFGFTKPSKNVIGVAGKKDPLTNYLPTHNRKTVDGGRGHDIPDYFMDKEVQKLFKEHLYK